MPLKIPIYPSAEKSEEDKHNREQAQIVLLEELQCFPLVFKGGTALRLLYGGGRFSEDLDFDVSHDMNDVERNSLTEEIRQHLQNKPDKWTRDNKVYGDADTFNYYFRAHYKAGQHKTRSVKIEVSRYKEGNRVHMLPLHEHTNARYVHAQVYDLDMLMTGKLNALFTRHSALDGKRVIKGRDIYDFAHFGKDREILWQFLDRHVPHEYAWLGISSKKPFHIG